MWHVPGVSPDITPYKFFEKVHGQGHVTPKFWALIANSSEMVKATGFKFDLQVSRNRPDMTS